MNALLRIAEWCCGPALRASVLEPLVADWQRELAATSGLRYISVAMRGFLGLCVCLVICALTGGTTEASAIGKGGAVLVVSTIVLLALQMGLNSLQFPLSYPLEMQMWTALPMVMPFAVPMAMLPAMMLLRGRLATTRSAAVMIAAGAVTAYLATAFTPLMRGDVRDSLFEQMNQRALANDAAGRIQYPGTAIRKLRPSTPEQRAAFRRDPRYLQYQAEITRPRFGRAAAINGALAIALGGFGWALAGLRRATPVAIFMWWSMVWVSLILLGGRFSYWIGGAGVRVGGAPHWLPPAIFSILAAVLLTAERRRVRDRS